jgi:hypothetical protein
MTERYTRLYEHQDQAAADTFEELWGDIGGIKGSGRVSSLQAKRQKRASHQDKEASEGR